jgi:hypothetical protein
MNRRLTVVVTIAAMLFAVSFALPATGATPSIGKVFKRAKKALRIAKRADRRAKKAVTASGIQEVEGPKKTFASGAVGSSIAFCPGGSRVISGGGLNATGAGDGIAASGANDGRTAWFVIGGNNASSAGTIQAVAYCTVGSRTGGARSDRAATKREVQATVERLKAAKK